MTQEDKDLLLIDLSTRLPYQPLCKKVDTEDVFCECDAQLGYSLRDLVDNKIIIKPYLRPMSSMTEEEKEDLLITLLGKNDTKYFQVLPDGSIDNNDAAHQDLSNFNIHWINFDGINTSTYIDWLNAHHFDYRGLIPKGLAIPVTKENNPYKTLKT